MTVFLDREDAGRRLSAALAHLRHEDPVVLAVPCGGVEVGAQVARGLRASLDVVAVCRLGAPTRPDLAAGVLGEGGIWEPDLQVIADLHVAGHDLAEARRRVGAEVGERARRWRRGRRRTTLAGRVVVLVDDGMETGATMQTACRVVRAAGARRVVVAVPVASAQAVTRLGEIADEVVVLVMPAAFSALEKWYVALGPVPDEEVTRVLSEGPAGRSCAEVRVPLAPGALQGLLTIPPAAAGVVVLAYGPGADRAGSADIAQSLCHLGLATLLLDLLSPEEAARNAAAEAGAGGLDPDGLAERLDVERLDVETLAGRLGVAVRWLAGEPGTAGLPVGLFGTGAGADAALVVATDPDAGIRAVVTCGALLAPAAARLPGVGAPTLLVVGGADTAVRHANEQAQARLGSANELVVVPGAGHLLEEPGALDAVAQVTSHWFAERLGG